MASTSPAVSQNVDHHGEGDGEGDESGHAGGGGGGRKETPQMGLTKEEEECHNNPLNNVNDKKDIWGSHNGYTPPMLLNKGGGCWWNTAAALLAVDPETEQPFAIVGPGEVNHDSASFFGASSDGYELTRDDDEDDAEQDDGSDNDDGGGDLARPSAWGTKNHTSAEEGSSLLDFRALADQALMALDDEYRTTLRASGGATNDSTPPHTPPEGEVEEESWHLPPIRLPTEDFGDAFFVTDFDDKDGMAEEATNARPLPDVDVEAVKRAVQAIQGRNPALQHHLNEWQSSSSVSQHQWTHWLSVAPRFHPLIPAVPLSAFGHQKSSIRARTATAHLTRAATLAEALHRLDLLQSQECFRIDLVGCDIVECASEALLRRHLEPLVRWIGAYAESPKHLMLRLVGPNIPVCAPTQPVALGGVVASPGGGDAATGRCLPSATAVCELGLYHECCDDSPSPEPDLRVAFHAGIWGYSDWRTTLEWMARDAVDGDGSVDRRKPIPFVVTGYTLQEAEDDADTVEAILKAGAGWNNDRIQAATLWRAEANAFASRLDRETSTAPPGRVYRENAAWSCFRI